MGDLSKLISSIKQNIKENDNQEITGDILQQQLLAIVNILNTEKQDSSSSELKTKNKTIVGAINELSDKIIEESGVGQKTDLGGEIFNDYYNNEANGLYSNSHGQCTVTNNTAESAFGKYNISNTSEENIELKTIFSVGIGNTAERKNAQEITENGEYYISGIGDYDGKTVEGKKSLQDVINEVNDKVIDFGGSLSKEEIIEILN